MKIVSRVVAILALAALHLFCSFFVSFAAGTSGGFWWTAASKVLTFPLFLLPDNAITQSLGWAIWFSVSLAWALAIFYLPRLLKK